MAPKCVQADIVHRVVPFWRFWTATTAANLADGIRAGAFPLVAAALAGGAFEVALVAACQSAAWLVFGLHAGLLADRRSPVRVVAVADTVRVVVLGALLVLLLLGAASIPLLAGAAFVLGATETFRDTSAQSVLPLLVPSGTLERANGRLVSTEVVGNEFLGPVLGASLFAVAVSVPVSVDASLLVVAVVLVLSLPGTDGGAQARVAADRGLLAGARWLVRYPRPRAITVAGAVIAFADAAWWSVLVLYSRDVLDLPAAGFGVLLAAGAVGGIAGALAADRLTRRFSAGAILVLGALGTGLPAAVLALTAAPAVAAAMLAASSAGFALWNVVARSMQQRSVPGEVLGRVTAVHRVALFGGATAGALVGGWLADAVGLTTPFTLAAGLAVAAAAGLGVVLAVPGR